MRVTVAVETETANKGRAPKPRRGRKLTLQQVGEIRRAFRSGERQSDLARRFGVSLTTINQAIAGRRGWYADVAEAQR